MQISAVIPADRGGNMKLTLRNVCYSKEDYDIHINTYEKHFMDENVKENSCDENTKLPVKECYSGESLNDITLKEAAAVEIIIENIILNSKYSIFVMIFYWICSIISGTGEKEPFARPYTLKLRFNVLGESDIVVRTNEYNSDVPFEVLSGDVEVLQNEFILDKGAKKKWILGAMLPQISLITLVNIFLLYLGLDSEGGFKVFFMLILIVFLGIELYFILNFRKIIKRK